MTDNVTLVTSADPSTPPTGTVIATDLIGGINYQRVKVTWGVDGAAVDASATDPLPVTDATLATLVTETGALTETAPATDTASSGLNGRLQRIAQRLTTLLGVFPATIDTNSGSKSASTLRVVLATDQPALTNKLLVTPDANSAVNVAQINGVALTTGNGISGTGVQRVTLASDSTGQVALAAGSNTVGAITGTTSASAGGISSTSRLVSAAASTNSTNVKGSAGRIYSIQCYNAATSVRYLKLYNKATAPTVGSDTPVKTIPLPPSTGMILDWANIGYSFATGIGFALTTGSADADTGVLTAADVVGLGIDYV